MEKWSDISQFDDSSESCGFLLWQTQLIWRRMLEKELATHNLTHPQFVILAATAYLTRNNMGVTQVELAKHTLCDINTTSQVLRSLEKMGLIKRISKPGNDKSKYPILTALGYHILKPAIKSVEDTDNKFFSSIPDSDLKIFKKYLLSLIQNFRNN